MAEDESLKSLIEQRVPNTDGIDWHEIIKLIE